MTSELTHRSNRGGSTTTADDSTTTTSAPASSRRRRTRSTYRILGWQVPSTTPVIVIMSLLIGLVCGMGISSLWLSGGGSGTSSSNTAVDSSTNGDSPRRMTATSPDNVSGNHKLTTMTTMHKKKKAHKKSHDKKQQLQELQHKQSIRQHGFLRPRKLDPPKFLPTPQQQQQQSNGMNYGEQLRNQGGYADRHIRNFLDITFSPLCQNPVIDMQDPKYSTKRAVEIFDKCRLLVFRNAFDVNLMKEYQQEFAEFIYGLKQGRISTTGGNTGGDSMFFAGRNRGRYEIVLPERFANEGIVAHEEILNVVQDPKLLGTNSALRSLQSLVAEGNQGGGTPGQTWHFDQGFIFGQEHGGLSTYGLAGHDLPPAAISLAMPLLDMERNVGPTEFCVGSSALNGVAPDAPVHDPTLKQAHDGLFYRYFDHHGSYCPAECWRSPLLKMGDAVLWDYGVRHRGGWNASPFMRSIVLLIYAKRWYDDINFGDKIRKHVPKDESNLMHDLMTRTRLALPDRDVPYSKDGPVQIPLEQMGGIEGVRYAKKPQPGVTTEYIVTNWDVDGRVGDGGGGGGDDGNRSPLLYVGDESQGELPVGQTLTVQGEFGDQMELRLDDKILGRFECGSDGGQFVFTKDTPAVEMA